MSNKTLPATGPAQRLVGYRCDKCDCTNVETENWTRFDLVTQSEVVTDHSGGGWYCPNCRKHGADVSGFELEGDALAEAEAHRESVRLAGHAPVLLAVLESVFASCDRNEGVSGEQCRQMFDVLAAARGRA